MHVFWTIILAVNSSLFCFDYSCFFFHFYTVCVHVNFTLISNFFSLSFSIPIVSLHFNEFIALIFFLLLFFNDNNIWLVSIWMNEHCCYLNNLLVNHQKGLRFFVIEMNLETFFFAANSFINNSVLKKCKKNMLFVTSAVYFCGSKVSLFESK